MFRDTVAIRWCCATVADAIAAGLEEQARQVEVAQAVRGLDSLDELALHPILRATLTAAGYGVWPEQRYPADRRKKRRSEGERCDLVLTPGGRPLVVPEAEATLFEPTAAVPLGQALWIEVKVVAQHLEGGPNGRYATELQQPVRRDVAKLAKDAGIGHAGVLLILFTADRRVADHDLAMWERRCLERGHLVEPPRVRRIDIGDRLNNRLCTIALFSVPRAESVR